MADEIKSNRKRKAKLRRSTGSDSDMCSPDGKKVFISTLNTKLSSEADISDIGVESVLDDSSDQVLKALKMTEGIGEKFELQRMEEKLRKTEDSLNQIANLEKAVSNIQTSFCLFNDKVKKLEVTIQEIETGLTASNLDIDALARKEEKTEKRIRELEDQILYQDVYSRKENLRFFGIPEPAQGVEDTKEVIHKFFEQELEVENAREIEFQRIHRLGKTKPGQTRPIIARFLRFPERELIFKSVRELGEEADVKVYADLPKTIRDRRKKLWPKMKKAWEEGKFCLL